MATRGQKRKAEALALAAALEVVEPDEDLQVEELEVVVPDDEVAEISDLPASSGGTGGGGGGKKARLTRMTKGEKALLLKSIADWKKLPIWRDQRSSSSSSAASASSRLDTVEDTIKYVHPLFSEAYGEGQAVRYCTKKMLLELSTPSAPGKKKKAIKSVAAAPIISAEDRAAAVEMARLKMATEQKRVSDLNLLRTNMAAEASLLVSEVEERMEENMFSDDAAEDLTLYDRLREMEGKLQEHTSHQPCLEVTSDIQGAQSTFLNAALAVGHNWAQPEQTRLLLALTQRSRVPALTGSASHDAVGDSINAQKRLQYAKTEEGKSAFKNVVKKLAKSCTAFDAAEAAERQARRIQSEEIQTSSSRAATAPPPVTAEDDDDQAKESRKRVLLKAITESTTQLVKDIAALQKEVGFDKSVSRGFACSSDPLDIRMLSTSHPPVVLPADDDEVGLFAAQGINAGTLWSTMVHVTNAISQAVFGCEVTAGQASAKRTKQGDELYTPPNTTNT